MSVNACLGEFMTYYIVKSLRIVGYLGFRITYIGATGNVLSCNYFVKKNYYSIILGEN